MASLGPFSQSLGVQPNIEIGNQWYFWKNDKMGVGMRVSWFQFGYSAYEVFGITSSVIDLRFIKVAPQFTYAFTDKMALDVSFEVAPTFFIGGGTLLAGALFAPGVKFRYNVFAVGFDLGFGSLAGGAASTTSVAIGAINILYPKVYLGFKF